MKLLKGHTTPETAKLVDDYPYGFRLRCKIRYWLEYKNGKGYRFVSQTTNPKKAFGALNLATGERSEPWNKPKASTYTYGLVVMTEDDRGYINYTGIRYDDCTAAKLESTLTLWRDLVNADSIAEAERFIRTKRDYEARKAAGEDYRLAAKGAVASELLGKHVEFKFKGMGIEVTQTDPNGCIAQYLNDNESRKQG